MPHKFNIAMLAYVMVAIATFGHAISGKSCPPAPTFCAEDVLVLTALNAAIWWPFYWSMKLQEPRP
jgi:hypothetical protein